MSSDTRTCFFTLNLPEIESDELMQQRLELAILNCDDSISKV